jgi:hypothetical protein
MIRLVVGLSAIRKSWRGRDYWDNFRIARYLGGKTIVELPESNPHENAFIAL